MPVAHPELLARRCNAVLQSLKQRTDAIAAIAGKKTSNGFAGANGGKRLHGSGNGKTTEGMPSLLPAIQEVMLGWDEGEYEDVSLLQALTTLIPPVSEAVMMAGDKSLSLPCMCVVLHQ